MALVNSTIRESLAKLFFHEETPARALDKLRNVAGAPTISRGCAELIRPDGRIEMISTAWFAENWCRENKGWSFRVL